MTKKAIIQLSLICCCLISTFAIAQSNSNYTLNLDKNTERESLWELFKYDAGSMVGGLGYAYTRPMHWQKDDLIIFGATAATTLGLYTFDNESSRYFRKQGDDVPQVIKDYGFYYGSPQNNYMAIGAVYLAGLFTRSEKVRRIGVLLTASATAAGILQQASKYAVGRARPQEQADRNVFRPFDFSAGAGFHSFPSGHTVLSITNAHIIAKLFRSPWIKAGIYTIGAVPPVTRLWNGAHWLTDVVLSSVLSIAIVEAVDKYLDSRYDAKLTKGPDEKSMSWNLQLAPGRLGVALQF